MSTSYNNCMYTTVPDEDIPVMFEAREEEAFQVILMNEEEMLSFGNALEEYYSKEEEEESL